VKISSALDAALFAHTLALRGKAYSQGTGILKSDTAATIRDVGHIGRVGMQPTDEEIVKLMIE
jgi:L-cysteine desulfidase